MLQTEDYAGVVLSHDRSSPIDLEERLRARMERRGILDRDDPPTAVFIIGEAALHHRVGCAETMRGQLVHVVEMAGRPDVIVQIVPRGAGYYAGLAGAFVIARLNGREVAFQDGIWSGQVLEGDAEVSTLTAAWQHILAKALTADASIKLIESVASTWKS